MSIFGVILVCIFQHSDWIGEKLRISPHSVQMLENTDQNNSEYGHFLRSYISLRHLLKGTCTFSNINIRKKKNRFIGFFHHPHKVQILFRLQNIYKYVKVHSCLPRFYPKIMFPLFRNDYFIKWWFFPRLLCCNVFTLLFYVI